MNPLLAKLKQMRDFGGSIRTVGLPDDLVERFAGSDVQLAQAINEAHAEHGRLAKEMPDFLSLDENEQLLRAQEGFINFYAEDCINPYLALAASGSWVVTLKGAVIHDNGGYGMLGFGHSPQPILDAMGGHQVMANIMTPSVSQMRLVKALRASIGTDRATPPYSHFMCLNSGSESVTLASRITDVNAKLMTDPGARHAGRTIKRLAVKGAFHGRTEGPALYSDSSRPAYEKHLASYRGEDSLLTIDPYDVDQLRQVFADADRNGWFIQALFLEPVMGEGDPGRAVTPQFYAAARELTREHGALLMVDSIQAGLRAHGVLSIIDYPGFESMDAPDMESYSKALNAGQYPLSVLALNSATAQLYRKGVYGNTMTSNPRAMDVAVQTLALVDADVRTNIRERGQEFLDKLQALSDELGGAITKVQGTGLLFSCELSGDYKCFGEGSTEEWMREHGYGVIHGGANSLRFTPHFRISSAEVDLVVDGVRRALTQGPRKSA